MENLKKLSTGRSICLIIGILGIVLGPIIFVHPSPFKCKYFDFTSTGSIGDTIGGITAPFIGLLSILLLWWTLKEQLAFNREQTKFNDANRLLAMETHISQLDRDLEIVFSTTQRKEKAYGLSQLKVLYNTGTVINLPDLDSVINRLHVIESAILALYSVVNNSKIEQEQKLISLGIVELYLSQISTFYGSVLNESIAIIPSIMDIHASDVGESNPKDLIKDKCNKYLESTKSFLTKCQKDISTISKNI